MSKYYKHPLYGHVYGEDLATPTVRVAWPYLVTAKPAMEPKEGQQKAQDKYELTFIFDKDSKKTQIFLETLQKQVDDLLKLYNEGKQTRISLAENLLKDGDSVKDAAEKYPYYLKSWFLSAKNSKPITVYGEKLVDGKLVSVDASTLQGGMEAAAVIRPKITAHGLSFDLKSVRILKDDGIRFGGSSAQDSSSLLALTEGSEEESSAPAEKKSGKKAAVDLLA